MNTLIGTVRLGHELMNSIRIRAVGLGESVIVVKACPLMTARGRKALCYAYGLLRFALVLIRDQYRGVYVGTLVLCVRLLVEKVSPMAEDGRSRLLLLPVSRSLPLLRDDSYCGMSEYGEDMDPKSNRIE